MIRITELPLALDYTPETLRQAVLKRLALPAADLLDFTLFKRSYDARKKNNAILFICTVDVTLRDEAAVLKRFARDRQVSVAPDTSYHPVAQAPAQLKERPLIVGLGPCGLFAALLLAQIGFKPIVLERGRPTDIPTIIWRALSKRARVVKHRHVRPFSGVRELTIRSLDERPLPLQVDGDYIGETPDATFAVTPRGIMVVS